MRLCYFGSEEGRKTCKDVGQMGKDVVVIGAGCAGMIAASEAWKGGSDVAIIDKGAIGLGTNSALSAGIFAGPTPNYSVEEYVRDTLQTGRGINYEPLVRLTAEEAPHAFSILRSSGLDLVEFPGGYVIRGAGRDSIRGLTLVKALAKEIRKSNRIEVLSGIYVTRILKSEDRAYGIIGFDKSGEEVIINASAVVMAAGGAGAIYLRNDNQKGIMGQGYYLAARAGLELWDMEFIQSYPLVIAQPGLPSSILYPPYPKEARLINAAGEGILEKHGIGEIHEAVSTKRDEFSAILFKESLKGPVKMDYRMVPSSKWKKPPLSFLPKRFDFSREPFIVSPAVHFFMGGVRTDRNGETSLPGLFACGEMVWGLHGANRMRGNALTECLVSGMIAGRSAARHAMIPGKAPVNIGGFLKKRHCVRISKRRELRELRDRARTIAWKYAGIVRYEEGLKQGLREIGELDVETRKLETAGASEVRMLEDLKGGIFTLRTILEASLSRRESRGSFIREDFPKTDDKHWRGNSCAAYEDDGNAIHVRFYPGSVKGAAKQTGV